MDGWQDVVWGIVGVAITALAGTGVGVLAAWIKNLKWVKKLKIEAFIDQAAAIAVSYAEARGRAEAAKGAEKLNVAKNAFQEELKRQDITLDAGDMERRLEAIFARLKQAIEQK